MLKKLIVNSTLWLVLIACLLFFAVGTLRWLAAWIYLVEIGTTGYILSAWLYQYDPELLKERLTFPIQKQQKFWDKLIIIIFMIAFFAWYLVIGLDARHLWIGEVPIALQVYGFISILVCMLFCFLTFKENTYAIPTVNIQPERHHKVIDTGVYRFVRHPMYTGMVFFLIGTPLMLGSWVGLIWGLLLIALLAYRAVFEERYLAKALTGYADYMQRVRYRFIPYLW